MTSRQLQLTVNMAGTDETGPTHQESENEEPSGPGFDLDPELDARLNQLLAWKMKEQKKKVTQKEAHGVSDSDSADTMSVVSQRSALECIPTKKKGKSSGSESGLSEGDRYRRNKVVSKKIKKTKTKKKKSKGSSSNSDSESSFPSSDPESSVSGAMVKQLSKASKKKRPERGRAVLVRSLLRNALEGHFSTFKPVEVITRGAERYTGVKGVEDSFMREMDHQVMMNDNMKRYEHSLSVMQTAILSAIAAIVPVANRMANEDRFTTLARGMNEGLELLAAASTFATYRRFENVYKGVTTEAGKEATRSKKVKDLDGKEYTLFLPPKPLKGKAWDNELMFGGQVPALLKLAESSNKCGKQFGNKRKAEETNFSFKRPRYEMRGRRGSFRGGRGNNNPQQAQSFRGRSQRNSFGWNEFNRPNFKTPAAQGKPLGFHKPNPK